MLIQRSAILWRGKCQEKEILKLRNMAGVHRAEGLLVHHIRESGQSWGSWVRISRGPMTSERICKASLSEKRKRQIALSGTSRTATHNNGDNKHSPLTLGFDGNARYSMMMAFG